MSGRHAKWTPERRIAQAERMAKLNASKTFKAKRLKACKLSPYRLARLRATMLKLNEARELNPELKARWKDNLVAANKRPQRLKQLRKHMAEISRRPERRQASREFLIALNKDPAVRKKGTATRRGLVVPDELLPLWNQIRAKVGAAEARRIMLAELERAA